MSAVEADDDPIRRVFLRSAGFVTARVLTGAAAILASLLLYRILGPEDAGRFQLVLAMGMTLGVVSGMGFLETLARFVPERSREDGERLFRRAAFLSFGLAVGIGGVLHLLLHATRFSGDAARVGGLLPAFVVIYALYTTALGILRGQGRLRVLPALDLGWNFGAKGAAVLALLVVPGFVSAFAAYTAFDLLVLLGALCLLRGALIGPMARFRSEEATFARLILLGEIIRVLSRAVDIYVVRGLIGPEATGIFMAGARVTTIVEQLILTPIGVPLLYYFSRPGSDELRRTVVENGTRVLGGVMGLGALCLAAASGPIVSILLGSQYQASIAVARLYTGHAVGASLLVLLLPLYNSRNRPDLGIAQAGLVLVLNLVLDLILVPRFGVVGAAASGVAAACAAAIVFAWLVRSRFGVEIRWGVIRVLGLYSICYAFMIAGWAGPAIAAYVVGLWALRLVRRSDLALLRRTPAG